jgi:hypothetical protein
MNKALARQTFLGVLAATCICFLVLRIPKITFHMRLIDDQVALS